MILLGDIHLKCILSYNEYVDGGRDKEKQDVLDFIVDQAKNEDKVIFLGDNFNTKNVPAETVKEFTNFIERFGDKKVYIISGNHEKFANGTTSIDYLKEIRDKNWTIVTNKIEKHDDMVFLPYLNNAELECKTNEEARDKIMEMLPDGKFLFGHHSVSGFFTGSGADVNDFPEVILPHEELSKKFKLSVMGHVHKPAILKNVIVAGSIFTYSTGSIQKYIYRVDEETLDVQKIELPNRPIVKLIDPTTKKIVELKNNSIVKVILTKSISVIKKEKLIKEIEAQVPDGGVIVVDQTSKVRKRQDYDVNLMDFDIDKLLELYAKEREVDLVKLKQGFELIRN